MLIFCYKPPCNKFNGAGSLKLIVFLGTYLCRYIVQLTSKLLGIVITALETVTKKSQYKCTMILKKSTKEGIVK